MNAQKTQMIVTTWQFVRILSEVSPARVKTDIKVQEIPATVSETIRQ